jgi:hypothetical protein
MGYRRVCLSFPAQHWRQVIGRVSDLAIRSAAGHLSPRGPELMQGIERLSRHLTAFEFPNGNQT